MSEDDRWRPERRYRRAPGARVGRHNAPGKRGCSLLLVTWLVFAIAAVAVKVVS